SPPTYISIVNHNEIRSYSKGAWVFSVLRGAGGIFTAVTVSPRSSPRQSFSRYTIRAGRNLPDKEFRYLRTVIVTADIHGDLATELPPPIQHSNPCSCLCVFSERPEYCRNALACARALVHPARCGKPHNRPTASLDAPVADDL